MSRWAAILSHSKNSPAASPSGPRAFSSSGRSATRRFQGSRSASPSPRGNPSSCQAAWRRRPHWPAGAIDNLSEFQTRSSRSKTAPSASGGEEGQGQRGGKEEGDFGRARPRGEFVGPAAGGWGRPQQFVQDPPQL